MLMSIVVLSYNRPDQVKRILENFLGVKRNDFEIVIKDDVSPRQSEITQIVNQFTSLLEVDVRLHVNKKNMGYDLNLIDAFSIVESEYVFLLSDDDYLKGESISEILDILVNTKENVYFTPYTDGGVINRAEIKPYELKRFSDVIYNSILFSGLVIKRKDVVSLNLNLEFLSNCIYSQVYIASLLIWRDQRFGVLPMGILFLGGDGENFFGKNPSAANTNLLSDRKKITADLNYQVFLLRVVDEIAKKTSPEIKKQFIGEYKKRLVSYGLRARAHGISAYMDFVRLCFSGQIRPQYVPFIFILMIILMPPFLSKNIYHFGLRSFRKSG